MKKIFEFKVFDLLQDKENAEFMDKVKKENPELYVKFLNILSNKGINVAKEKYEDYDPNRVKIRNEREKELRLRRKRENTKEAKTAKNKELLEKYKNEIDEIENVIYSSKLDIIDNKLKSYNIISEYLNSCRVKKRYENNFNKLLKTPENIEYELRGSLLLESIWYTTNSFSLWESDKINIIHIQHFYNFKNKQSTFYPRFNLYYDEFEEYTIPVDRNKESEYLEKRRAYANDLTKEGRLTLDEISNTIKKVSILLSDEMYKEWKFEQDLNKYNL